MTLPIQSGSPIQWQKGVEEGVKQPLFRPPAPSDLPIVPRQPTAEGVNSVDKGPIQSLPTIPLQGQALMLLQLLQDMRAERQGGGQS